MCGIAGFIHPNWGTTELKAMADAIQHRGPDAEGFYHDSDFPLHFAHRRLSIIDLNPESNQPFLSSCGRYVMVFNGEIYNYLDLKKKFQLTTRTQSDTEVLIELFKLKGIDMLSELNGMFAVVIWDKTEQKLWMFRDRFGVKPLVYHLHSKGIAFASELKSLLQLPIDRDINMEALGDFLHLEYIPKPNTIFKNIHKLPSGHFASYTIKSGLKIQRWYDIAEKITSYSSSFKTATEELDGLLRSSVNYRLISDVPVGAFLSGGTDSSLVVSHFQQLRASQPADTFTIGFDIDSFDETKYARAVAEHLHTRHHEKRMTEQDLLKASEEFIEFYDEPFGGSSALPTSLVSKNAREQATVALSGDGGDEFFLGYGVHSLFPKMQRWNKWMGSGSLTGAGSLMQLGNQRWQRIGRLFQSFGANPSYISLWSQDQYMFQEKEVGKLLKNNYQHETTYDYFSQINKTIQDPTQIASLMDIEYYLSDNLLYKVDQASMQHALEVRNPFLDYRVAEFALSLPLEYKIKGNEQKYILKKSLEKYLPKEIVYRKKWGFPAPVGQWLEESQRHLIDTYLNPQRIKQQGIFNEMEVSRFVNEFKSGKHYHFKRIWGLLVFQFWHERFYGK